ncbi:hypothetical protein DPMN_098279 [Dreissena polymorpha]|uniref:Uncharacterized protein n=1 Tax=Dreissena polymorpha TaxID=45954 RepID=A0A9D4LDB1_DREPO|nr:hypothetical protein DPMN_098279 [Dreissena polymorpha]
MHFYQSLYLSFPFFFFRQSKTTILCLKEAAADCTGEQKDGFSLLTSVIEQAMVSACQPDTCSLGVAEQCVIEAVYAVRNPLYREGGSTLTCG